MAFVRGLFRGYVVGATDEEISNKVGTRDSVDAGDPKGSRWVYHKKTFDPENQNQVDGRTVVILQRDAQRKLRGTAVIFSAN